MNWSERFAKGIDEYYPVPFWSWNTELEPERLREQIREMKEASMGGFFMHARSGLKTEYMGEDWFRAVEISVDEAQKQKMQAWIYDENGWPSGFAGMKLLDDAENLAHFLRYECITSFDANALANYAVSNGKLIHLTAPNSDYDEIHAIYDNVSPSAVDVLNKEVVRKFLSLTHEVYAEKYKGQLGSKILGFFTDEPQYYRSETPYSPVLSEEFENRYGENLLDALGMLFVDCENCYAFRWKYWKMLNDLFTESFGKQVYDWCEEHHCRLTGHAIEESQLHTQMWCCAGVMPFYEYEHIPGCDWLGRNCDTEMTPRQVSSVAQQLGKKRVLTESFACTGWDVTIAELKKIVDWQFVNGVNMLCSHLTPLSLEGNRKFDHPAFFCKENPWFEKFSVLSEYVGKLGCMLTESTESVSVGVIHPIHSAYLTYQRKTDAASIGSLNKDFKVLIETLGQANIPHHYIDETLLKKYGKVENGQLQLGCCTYRYVVIPSVWQLDASTCEILKEFLAQGGKVYLAGERPTYINGEQADFDFLQSNITFSDLENENYSIFPTDTGIRSTYRTSPNGDFLYAVNLGGNSHHVIFHLRKDNVKKFDLMTGKIKPLQIVPENNGCSVELDFAPGESVILLSNDTSAVACATERAEGVTFTEPAMSARTDNTLTLDMAQYSFDGVTFSEKFPVAYIAEYFIGRSENGDVYLKFSFNVEKLPKKISFEAEKMNATEWQINGKTVVPKMPGRLGINFVTADIFPYLVKGENTICVKLKYYQDENVYWVLNHRDQVTEGVLNCLTLNTEIDNLYLHGDFAVQTAQPMEEKDGIFFANGGFSVTEPKAAPMQMLTDSGYPFFAGKVTYNCTAAVERTGDVHFKLNGHFGAAHIRWNHFECDIVLSDRAVIPAKFVKPNNEVQITLYSGNRNMLGPHHFARTAEPKTVFPGMFTLAGGWKQDGKNDFYRPSYALVPFGAIPETE